MEQITPIPHGGVRGEKTKAPWGEGLKGTTFAQFDTPNFLKSLETAVPSQSLSLSLCSKVSMKQTQTLEGNRFLFLWFGVALFTSWWVCQSLKPSLMSTQASVADRFTL